MVSNTLRITTIYVYHFHIYYYLIFIENWKLSDIVEVSMLFITKIMSHDLRKYYIIKSWFFSVCNEFQSSYFVWWMRKCQILVLFPTALSINRLRIQCITNHQCWCIYDQHIGKEKNMKRFGFTLQQIYFLK